MPKLRPTVLVVDDEEDLRELVAAALESAGCSILTAANGDAAVRILEGILRIDLVLSDVVMPGTLNGFALAARARQLWPGIRIVLTSGWISPDVAGEMSNGFYRFLPKPWRLNELLNAVAEEFAKKPLPGGTSRGISRSAAP